MDKTEVLKIIDEALSNTVSGIATKALLDVRAKVKAMEEPEDRKYCARLKLVGDNPLNVGRGWFEGAKYIHIETSFEVAEDVYGAFWYE